MSKKKIETYICQFCGEETPAKDWIKDKCPKCKKEYNVIMAQDSEE
jgi:hypothetical protein